MIIVADTSPINYLVLIGQIRILPGLYDRVLLPTEVHSELLRTGSPDSVRRWAEDLPDWCEVRAVTCTDDHELQGLDNGERAAILLALETGIDMILMDELEGRREAVRRNLIVTGTLGVLEKAAQRGWIDFREGLRQLSETNFRISAEVRRLLLERNP